MFLSRRTWEKCGVRWFCQDGDGKMVQVDSSVAIGSQQEAEDIEWAWDTAAGAVHCNHQAHRGKEQLSPGTLMGPSATSRWRSAQEADFRPWPLSCSGQGPQLVVLS